MYAANYKQTFTFKSVYRITHRLGKAKVNQTLLAEIYFMSAHNMLYLYTYTYIHSRYDVSLQVLSQRGECEYYEIEEEKP